MTYEIRTLTQNHVNIRVIDELGRYERKTYHNSEIDRERLQNEIPSPYKDAVLLIWGSEPTALDEVTAE